MEICEEFDVREIAFDPYMARQVQPGILEKAWEAMTGNIVRREEWQIIRDMDRSYLETANARDGDGAPVRSSSVELTRGAFDAMFA